MNEKMSKFFPGREKKRKTIIEFTMIDDHDESNEKSDLKTDHAYTYE